MCVYIHILILLKHYSPVACPNCRDLKCNLPGEILWDSIQLGGNSVAAQGRHRKIVQDDRAGDPSSAKVTNITTHIKHSLLHAIGYRRTE